MDISALIQILNSGISSEAIGGITSAVVIDLFKRAKKLYKGKEINEETTNNLLESNEEFKGIVNQIESELQQSGLTINKAKNLFINSKFDNTTFK